ncbi:MAG TPA: 3-oxoacyl-ACP reductase family protein [Xanthobacteraceae bacterium]|nr:3-oxoacyl-ACP reductase family protein [Xanthobacteraceae bacterium]
MALAQRHAGKVALISGAARGIGQAYAVRLASEGADIVVADIEDGADTVERIEALGRSAIAFTCDVGDPDDVSDLGREVARAFGRCDILVNNAGLIPSQPFADVTFEDWRRILSTNLDAVFLMSSEFAPGMRERGWGRIVNIASNTVGQVAPGMTHYIASKAGVIGFTRALATDLGKDGVTVNAIAPGLTRTPGTIALADNYRGMTQDELYAAVAQKQAIPRPQQPDDLVGALSFLASDDAAFMTGQTLYIDGGLVRA